MNQKKKLSEVERPRKKELHQCTFLIYLGAATSTGVDGDQRARPRFVPLHKTETPPLERTVEEVTPSKVIITNGHLLLFHQQTRRLEAHYTAERFSFNSNTFSTLC